MLPWYRCKLWKEASMNSTKNKRDDIQGLRALAIIHVFLFHFTKNFPHGYTGVDIFFVISGYVMALVLAKEKAITMSVCKEFYLRRITRIFPVYYFTMMLVLVTSTIFLDGIWTSGHLRYMREALFLTHNLRKFFNTPKPLTVHHPQFSLQFIHSWSLCVEIQFYLIVPLIFYFIKNVLKSNPGNVVVFLTILAAPSYYFYWSGVTGHRGDDHKDTFRKIWEFCVGIAAFYMSKQTVTVRPDDVQKEQYVSLIGNPERLVPTKYNQGHPERLFIRNILLILFTLFLFSTFLLHYRLGHFWMRTLIVPSTVGIVPCTVGIFARRTAVELKKACILILGSFVQTPILSNRIFSYIGDASYTIYMLHWPALRVTEFFMFKYFHTKQYTKEAVVVTMLLSLMVHHLFEKPLLRASRKTCLIVTAICFGTSAYLCRAQKYFL